MARMVDLCRAAVVSVGLLVFACAGAARAQSALEAPEIHDCLCMERSISTLSHQMTAKQQALDAVRHRLAALDAQLQREYPKVQVNDSASVQHYKVLLARRDAVYQRSMGAVYSEAAEAAARYNARVKEYNERCAGQQFNSELMEEAKANLSCPAE